MAGTPEKMVEYLLETRMDNSNTTNFDGRVINLLEQFSIECQK